MTPAARGLTFDRFVALIGVGLTVYQSVFASTDRPYLYVLYAGMMGLPFVNIADRVLQSRDK